MEPPPQPPQEVELDDADTALLAKSNVLTREEVLKRRMHRLRLLSKFYRDYYWMLMEEVRRKHREFYWIYGKSPYVEDEEDDVAEERENGNSDGFRRNKNENGNNGGFEERLGFGKSISWCMYKGCAAKAMAMTRYCVDHIVWDSKQLLYKPCKSPLRRSEDRGSVSILCNRPILKSMSPSICHQHVPRYKREIGQVLKKGGVPPTLAGRISSKLNFHHVINEYVHLIQSRRRAMASRNIDCIEVDNGSS